MTISGPGLFVLTFEQMFIDGVGKSLESETDIKQLLVEDGYTPNFATQFRRNSIGTNEVGGAGYPSGGIVATATEFVINQPAAGQAMWDHNDVYSPIMTVNGIMGAIDYIVLGSSGTDMMIALMDFVTAVDVDDGILVVQTPTTGVWYMDYTPP